VSVLILQRERAGFVYPADAVEIQNLGEIPFAIMREMDGAALSLWFCLFLGCVFRPVARMRPYAAQRQRCQMRHRDNKTGVLVGQRNRFFKIDADGAECFPAASNGNAENRGYTGLFSQFRILYAAVVLHVFYKYGFAAGYLFQTGVGVQQSLTQIEGRQFPRGRVNKAGAG
jgi:hypothetical protein